MSTSASRPNRRAARLIAALWIRAGLCSNVISGWRRAASLTIAPVPSVLPPSVTTMRMRRKDGASARRPSSTP